MRQYPHLVYVSRSVGGSKLIEQYCFRVEDANQILFSRETLCNAMVRHSYLRDLVQSSIPEIRTMEIRSVVESSRMSRNHGALQSALKSAMYLSNLIEPSRRLGIEIEAVAGFEAAGVLWDQGEMTASIRMLRGLRDAFNLSQQTIRIGSAELLAKLVSFSSYLKYVLLTTPPRDVKLPKLVWSSLKKLSLTTFNQLSRS